MSLVEVLSQHAAKATIGALVAGFFTGALFVLRRGATNASALAMLELEIKHRDEIRELDRQGNAAQFAAIRSEMARMQVEMQTGHKELETAKNTIMQKLNDMSAEQRK